MQRLKQRLDSGKPVLSGWCGITDPRYLETIAEYDFDAILLDMQHGFFDETTVQQGIATLVARGKAPLVRIPLALGYGSAGDGFRRTGGRSPHDQQRR